MATLEANFGSPKTRVNITGLGHEGSSAERTTIFIPPAKINGRYYTKYSTLRGRVESFPTTHDVKITVTHPLMSAIVRGSIKLLDETTMGHPHLKETAEQNAIKRAALMVRIAVKLHGG